MNCPHGKADASRSRAARFAAAVFFVVLAVSILLPGDAPVEASGPYGAAYCSDTNRVFWFIHMSDTHIGASGSTDTDRLTWVVNTGRSVIKPLFTVVTGDLTDSTNGNWLGYPNGPYLAEWQSYRNILNAAGVTTGDYYDIPGNHDGYNDGQFSYYRSYGMQGPEYARAGQVAWTKALPFGTYHFLAVNTADNTGAPFSLGWPYGDYAGLDANELAGIGSDLAAANAGGASLAFVFGHHPVTGTGDSQDTYLFYGSQQFVSDLSLNGASAYNYGHVHDNVETLFTGDGYTGSIAPGVRYARVASLGKSGGNNYAVVSVDCNGISAVTQPAGTWPLVLVTAPVSRYVGGALNPFGYDVPASASNPIRALVFDAGTVTQVRFRIDGGVTWFGMTRTATGSPLWAGTWNASAVAPGEHAIEVQAVGTTTRSHSVKVKVTSVGNRPPIATGDAYSTPSGLPLTIAAPGVLANDTDPDGNALSATLGEGPLHGSVNLAPDGGFTYTPATGFSGSDGFTYQASDGTASSGAAVTITVTAPVSDTVAITTAAYTRRTRTLLVKATSSAAPTAILTIVGYGAMTYNAKSKVYVYQAKVASQPTSVTVQSSAGGSATRMVTTK